MRIFENKERDNSDLIIDAIYEGGNSGDSSDNPINKLKPK
jgi:hypothetical protein